ncbi:MAG: hypothetical protein ABIC82_01970 [bacterium]
MVVEKILKEVTPERAKKEIEAIKNTKLPEELQRWVDEYEKVGERDGFIWKWSYKALLTIQFPVTQKKYLKSLMYIKMLLAMFVILLDDIADKEQNEKLLTELLKIPFAKNYIKTEKLNKKEKLYLKFTTKIWQQLNLLIKKLPYYKKFKKIFIYDINQILNAINFDYLINKNHSIINKTEYWLYSPNTMQIVAGTTINLMCIHDFSMSELSEIREMSWHAQKMARVGNWVSTWEREIKENDFTSGIFAYAINSKIITTKDFISMDYFKIIKKIKKAKIKNKLLQEWTHTYKEILQFKKELKKANVKKFLIGSEKLLLLEMVSEKYK